MAALIFFLMARRRGASAGNASELPASRDDLGPSASSGPPPPQQQQQEVKSGWGLAGEPLPGQQQQQYHHADPAQYVGSGPYELYSGPHGPELPSHERPQEMPSFSTVPHGAQQGGKW